jgi:hypothetical protein
MEALSAGSEAFALQTFGKIGETAEEVGHIIEVANVFQDGERPGHLVETRKEV